MSNATLPAAPVKSARKPRTVKPKSAPVFTLTLTIWSAEAGNADYGVQVIPCEGFGRRAVRLTKRSDGSTYDVLVTADRVECSCPDWHVRHADGNTCCKHGAGLLAVGLIEAPDAARFPTPEDFAPVASRPGVDRIRDEFDAPSEGFADELAEAVGLPVLDPPADAPDEPRTEEVDAEPEPIGWEKRPARSYLMAPRPSERPARLAPMPDGKYLLHELVEAQGAILRGQGGPVFGLMADALDQLAKSIRATGATCVADVQDRLASMEDDRLAAVEARGYDRGLADGYNGV